MVVVELIAEAEIANLGTAKSFLKAGDCLKAR